MENQLLRDRDYNLWWLLHQTRHVLSKVRNKELSRYGVTGRQAAVAFYIKVIAATEGEATPGKVAKWMLREPHTVSRILTRMEKDGLVNKSRSSGKKNEIYITLTEKGEQVHRQALKVEAFREIMSCLSEEERQQMDSSLQKLRDKGLESLKEASKVPFP